MLEKLLKIIREDGGTFTPASLAARLKTSPSLVQAMLEDLGRRGYLSNYINESSQSACDSCGLKSACQVASCPQPQLWTVVAAEHKAN
jgi:hypothetical protein